jgi:hypothetical protein
MHRKCQLWVYTRLPNLNTTWMAPLVTVMYSGLTQSAFRPDKVFLLTVQRKSLLICALMSAALRLLGLVAAHLKFQSFVQFCAWSMLLLGHEPPLAHYSLFIVWFARTLSQKFFFTAFKGFYAFQVHEN